MSVAMWRHDYLKFVVTCPIGTSHVWVDELREAYRITFPKGDFDRCSNVHAMYSMSDRFETTLIDVWGEGAELVRYLNFDHWAPFLQRMDARGEDWDASEEAVQNLGIHLTTHLTKWNVHLYNTKNASKRKGRDRGGKGFTVGSRKSQFHFTIYKRNGEKVAIEYRMSGARLGTAAKLVEEILGKKAGTVDLWQALQREIIIEGEKRLAECFENTGLGTYYPTWSSETVPELPPAQHTFDTMRAMMGTDPDSAREESQDEVDYWHDSAG